MTEDDRQKIRTLFGDLRSIKITENAYERILKLAKAGQDRPEALSPMEIAQVCYALVIHYAQMGIG